MRHSYWHPSRANGNNVGFLGITLGIIGFAIYPMIGIVTFLIGCKIDEHIKDMEIKQKFKK